LTDNALVNLGLTASAGSYSAGNVDIDLNVTKSQSGIITRSRSRNMLDNNSVPNGGSPKGGFHSNTGVSDDYGYYDPVEDLDLKSVAVASSIPSSVLSAVTAIQHTVGLFYVFICLYKYNYVLILHIYLYVYIFIWLISLLMHEFEFKRLCYVDNIFIS
jgi:hypothetical protein